MSYTHKVIEFYGDPINFFINEESVLVGGRSLINALGFSWSGQLRRAKRDRRQCALMCTLSVEWSIKKIECFSRSGIKSFFDSFNTKRISSAIKDKFLLYKKEFPQFSYDQTTFGNQVEIEDFYLGSIEGIKQLIYDAVIKLGNEKAIEQLALILFPLLTEPIISNDHIEIFGPAYDSAEKTADRQNELIKHKSTSISKQLEIVAENIRDTDRKSSLELRRIAKSVN